MKGKITKNIAYGALFTALIAASAWIAVPVPQTGISFTLQTFAVLLAASLGGWKTGTAAVLCYIAIGAIGAPVFSGFRGGVGVIAGVTGGYIVGFVLTALVVGLSRRFFGMKILPLAVSMTLGVLICYAFGTAWFSAISGGETTFFAALSLCVLPYIPFDAIKIAAAVFIARKTYKFVDLGGENER